MGSPVYPISPSFGGGSGTSDHSQLTNRSAADQHPVTSITGATSKTEADLTLYVYEDATGTGDGSSKANGFTSLQAAIDAIPDVSQNVTIIVSKGSTNYLGDTTTIQKASVKSLTIRGEFYSYGACGANAVAGKVVSSAFNVSNFEVGDRVVCTKYSGTVGSSGIDDYFYATVTEVGSGYVQTSEATKVPTTGWRFLINQTVFDGDNANIDILTVYSLSSLNCEGICNINTTGTAIKSRLESPRCSITKSIFKKAGVLGYAYCFFGNCACIDIGVSKIGIQFRVGSGFVDNCVVSGESASNNTGVSLIDGSTAEIVYSGIFSVAFSSFSGRPTTKTRLLNCYIDSSCTYGAYGYNITLESCTNNATTPISLQLSGVNAKYWGGFDLPGTTGMGGKYLRLKSDATGFEFVDLP